MGDDPPLMRLGRDNGELPSLRELFILLVTDDPTEVEFAEHVFGDYAFWDNITSCKWMESYLKEWRLITDARRKTKAFKAILSEIEGDGRSAFTAAKFIIEEPWKDKRNPKVKDEVNQSTARAAKDIDSDIVRMKEFMK